MKNTIETVKVETEEVILLMFKMVIWMMSLKK